MGAVALRVEDASSALLRLLGGFSLSLAGSPVSLPVNGQRLLAYLSIRGQVPRPVVAGTLWPEVSEHNAHGSLRTTIWRLHRSGARLVEATGENLALSPDVTVDIRVFAKAAQRALHSPVLLDSVGQGVGQGVGHGVSQGVGQGVGERAAGEGMGIVDGESGLMATCELLPGWYDDWVIFERERLRQLRLHTLEALAQRLAQQHRFAAALDTALEAIRIEPLRESAHRVVIGIHLAEGNVVEAVRHYRFVRELLLEELGVEPSDQLTTMLPATVRTPRPVGPAPAVTRLDMAR